MSKWAFNEATKTLISGRPDTVVINPKYGSKYSMRMFCGVIITTNHLTQGIYIPQDDRRYDVIECATKREIGMDKQQFSDYFNELWAWFNNEDGRENIVAYLENRDISNFNASTGQRQTSAHKVVVQQALNYDHWLHDIIDELGDPVAIRGDWIIEKAVATGMKEVEVRRLMVHAIDRTEYRKLPNLKSADGRFRFGTGKKFTLYAKYGIGENEALNAVDKELF
jgi:hypothetical protein